jgi:hypothetical protein
VRQSPRYPILCTLARWLVIRCCLVTFFSSLTREVLMSVTMHSTSAAMWAALDKMFGSHTHVQTVHTRIALATTRKGLSTMGKYYSKMKNLAEEMAASGSCLGDEEFIAYVLSGLDEEIYNSLVSSIVTHVEPISPSELYSQMISFQLHLEKQSAGGFSSLPSANAASRGCGGPWRGSGNSAWPWALSWQWSQCSHQWIAWQIQQHPSISWPGLRYGWGTRTSSVPSVWQGWSHRRCLLVPLR